MKILARLFQNEETKSSRLSFRELVKQLTNFSEEDFKNLKDVASGARYDGKDESPESKSFLDIVKATFSRSYNYGDTSLQSREQLYNIYDEMDQEVSYISAALDILSDDATQRDQNGELIKIITDSDKVHSITQDFFDDFGIEDRLPKWARVVAKYGDYFIRVVSEESIGITKITDTIYPSEVERLDFDGELIAFSDNKGLETTNIKPPWEYVHFKHKGDLTNSNRDRSSRLINSEDSQHDLTSSYGQSVLRPAIKVYAQLRFVENMILLSRLTNSVRRNIFMVNVGDVSPEKSFETIQNYADLLKKNVNFNLEEGIYNSQKKTISYDEDIFIPVSDPKNDVKIEQIGGDVNIAEQYDLEYLLNKLFSALKIPKAYLNYEQDLNARSTLIQLDIRYARSVAGLQQTLCTGLLRLAKINLAFHGLDPESIDLDIQLVPVSTIDEESKRQETLSKIEVANNLWRTITDINDKITPQGDPGGGGGGLEGLFGESTEPQDSNPKEENTESSGIDLKYAAELILTDYVGFSSDEVDRLLHKSKKKTTEDSKENSSNSKPTRRVTFRRTNSDPDLRSLYPTREGMISYKSLREHLLTSKHFDN